MNSILRPKIGLTTIKNTGGEINMEMINIMNSKENIPLESLKLLSNKDLRALIEDINNDIRKLPKRYHVENGIVREVKDFDIEIFETRTSLEERRKACYNIINKKNRRNPTRKKIIKSYEITSVEDNGNKIQKGYITIEGVYLPNVITKACVCPYSREGKLKKRDLFFLHKSGRLGMKFKHEKHVKLTTECSFPPIEELILELFKIAHKKGAEFFVILPKGGGRKKEYGQIPMLPSEYNKKGSEIVPINQVIKKVYIPEIDGKTPKGKETINEYRGKVEGYGPIYEYNEENIIRKFLPGILSFNFVDYSQKSIVLLGKEEDIKRIDNRIEKKNKIKNGYHKFTKEKVIPYTGQKSRCKNSRIVATKDGVQVFGLNLRGTPEEDLKGYLRGFDRTPSKRDDEEVKEFLEIAQKTDGRQTIRNIEYDIRSEIKYIKTRSSKDIYYLILGVEDSINGALSKKEQALINVLESFKSSREIEENEGKGLTSDIEDLVTIEEKANDSSYKKSKNLFSQQLGVLTRNQNPLRMEGGFEQNKSWKGKALPISFPRNSKIPKRNIPFIKRKTIKRFGIPLGTMFSRDFNYSIKTQKTQTQDGFKSKEVGIQIKRNPSFYSASETKSVLETLFMLLEKEFIKCKKLSAKRKEVDLRRHFVLLETKFEQCEKESEKYWEKYWSEKMTIPLPEPRFPARITGYDLGLPKEPAMVYKKPSTYQKYIQNDRCVSTVRLFDDRRRPGPVMKKVTYKQFLASEQQAYQFGEKQFETTGEVKMEDGSILRTGKVVRFSHNNPPSSFEIIHTFGDKKGNIDYYLIEINGQRLYAKGDLSLLNKKSVSFTGTRTPHEKTKAFVKMTMELVCSKNYVTISGGAKGCDSIVHSQTMKNQGKTIMVLAGGFNNFDKKCKAILKRNGLVLSEHPVNHIPTKRDFVKRNKVIASLSDILIVFEAGNGTMHCAKYGIELGKQLWVQPNFVNNEKLLNGRKGKLFYPIEGFHPF